jgi:hypothetical protein
MSFQGHRTIDHPDGFRPESWHAFTCGHFNRAVTGIVVSIYGSIKWMLCPSCINASVLSKDGLLYPSAAFGPVIEGLPAEVDSAYHEARMCLTVNGFTACELICRKILMHVAVEKGAQPGDTFNNYLQYLVTKGYVTPPMKGWVDLIRKHGNQSTHELPSPDKSRAESTLMFTAELLRLIYEMDYLSSKYTQIKL